MRRILNPEKGRMRTPGSQKVPLRAVQEHRPTFVSRCAKKPFFAGIWAVVGRTPETQIALRTQPPFSASIPQPTPPAAPWRWR